MTRLSDQQVDAIAQQVLRRMGGGRRGPAPAARTIRRTAAANNDSAHSTTWMRPSKRPKRLSKRSTS